MTVVEKLEKLLLDVPALHNQLILLVGSAGCGKTLALRSLAKKLGDLPYGVTPLNIGSALGSRLLSMPGKARSFEVANLLRELTNEHCREGVLLLDNIEILFDTQLQLDPLDLLKRQAQSRPVVATWPGTLQDGRLIYARMGHPEHQDYAASGLVYLQIYA